MELVVWVIVIVVVVLLQRLSVPHIDRGEFTRPGSRTYHYHIGNNIQFGGKLTTKFHGIQVDLPAYLPHIYLDASKNQGTAGPRMYIDPSQRIKLEGDFNKYFTAYVVNGEQDLALSILTPDVLQTLKDHVNGMDVEIYHNRLRIISNKRVWRRPDREEPLYLAAQKMLAEIDHKLNSWSEEDNQRALGKDLVMQDMPMVRLLGFTVAMSSIIVTLAWGPISAFAWYMVYRDHQTGYYHLGNSMTADLITAIICFPLIFGILFYGAPHGWFQKVADWYANSKRIG